MCLRQSRGVLHSAVISSLASRVIRWESCELFLSGIEGLVGGRAKVSDTIYDILNVIYSVVSYYDLGDVW